MDPRCGADAHRDSRPPRPRRDAASRPDLLDRDREHEAARHERRSFRHSPGLRRRRRPPTVARPTRDRRSSQTMADRAVARRAVARPARRHARSAPEPARRVTSCSPRHRVSAAEHARGGGPSDRLHRGGGTSAFTSRRRPTEAVSDPARVAAFDAVWIGESAQRQLQHKAKRITPPANRPGTTKHMDSSPRLAQQVGEAYRQTRCSTDDLLHYQGRRSKLDERNRRGATTSIVPLSSEPTQACKVFRHEALAGRAMSLPSPTPASSIPRATASSRGGLVDRRRPHRRGVRGPAPRPRLRRPLPRARHRRHRRQGRRAGRAAQGELPHRRRRRRRRAASPRW